MGLAWLSLRTRSQFSADEPRALPCAGMKTPLASPRPPLAHDLGTIFAPEESSFAPVGAQTRHLQLTQKRFPLD